MKIDIIVKEIILKLSIEIVLAYREQIEKSRYKVNDESIQVNTIHKYQGR